MYCITNRSLSAWHHLAGFYYYLSLLWYRNIHLLLFYIGLCKYKKRDPKVSVSCYTFTHITICNSSLCSVCFVFNTMLSESFPWDTGATFMMNILFVIAFDEETFTYWNIFIQPRVFESLESACAAGRSNVGCWTNNVIRCHSEWLDYHSILDYCVRQVKHKKRDPKVPWSMDPMDHMRLSTRTLR